MTPRLPPISAELLAALEQRFPDRLPDLNVPERELWARVGRVEVVRLLRREFDQQNKTVLAETR